MYEYKGKISVIIPVFNSERYIAKCLESIIAQTYPAWEIICIDDGSTDQSGRIIQSYQKTYHNIYLITQANSGPGKARNTGIKKATGDYLFFIDSDDYINEFFFEELAKNANNADVVFFDICQVNKKEQKIKDEKMSIYSKFEKDKLIRHQMTGKIPWGGCRKVVKKKLLEDHAILFSDIPVGEEALYSFRVLEAAKKIVFLDTRIMYFYNIHPGSQSKKKALDPLHEVHKIMREYICSQNLFEKYENTLNALELVAFMVSVDRATQYFSFKEALQYVEKQWKLKNWDFKNNKVDFSSLNKRAKLIYIFLRIRCTFALVAIVYLKNSVELNLINYVKRE